MGVITYGADDLFWGDQSLAWGGVFEPYQPPAVAIFHTTIHLIEPDNSHVRVWDGPGELIHDSRTWVSAPPWLLDVSPPTNTREPADADRVRVQIALPGETWEVELSRFSIVDPGVVQVIIRQVYSSDSGVTWQWTPGAYFAGVLSAPTITGPEGNIGRAYTFDVATKQSDLARGFVQYWDDDSQQRRYPNLTPRDNYFRHVQSLALGTQLQRWPNRLPDRLTPTGMDPVEQDPDDTPPHDEGTGTIPPPDRGGEGGQ